MAGPSSVPQRATYTFRRPLELSSEAPPLDIDSLRSFLVVAELGNITHAAQRLHVTQPTLSRRIAGLEHELGVKLVNREHRSVSLTPAGEALRGEAGEIVRRADSLPALLASAAGKAATDTSAAAPQRTLHLAHQSKIDETLMARIGQLVRARHDGVSLEVSHAYPTELRAGVGSGRFDAVFFLRPHLGHPSPRTTYVLRQSALMLMVPANHPFASRESVNMAELQDQRVIMLERKVSPEIVDFVNSKFIETGFSLNAVRYVHDFDNGVVQVAAGNGISFCHEMMAGLSELRHQDIRLVHLSGADMSFDYVMRLSDALDEPLRHALANAAKDVVDGELTQV